MGLAAVRALARAGGSPASAYPRTPRRGRPRRPRVGGRHAVHHVGRQARLRAAATVLERVPRAQRQDVRAPGRRAGRVVLLPGREQRAGRPRGKGRFPPALLQGPHEPPAAGPHPLLLFQPRQPPGGARRVRGRLDGRRGVGRGPPGLAGFFPDRTVLPLLRPRGRGLPRADLPQALAPARRASVVLPLDDGRGPGAALAGRTAAAAPAGRVLEGESLAQEEGRVATHTRRSTLGTRIRVGVAPRRTRTARVAARLPGTARSRAIL